MRSNHARIALVLAASIAAVCTSACKKSADDEHRRASRTELREQRTAPPEPHVIGERNDYFATVRREQLQLRARLQEEIGAIDRKLAEMKVELRDGGYVVDPRSRNAARIKELIERRTQLEEDIATVERADERGWDELKGTIEKDLGERPRGRI